MRQYWGSVLGVDPDQIRFLRKSNSGQLNGRKFRSENGVLTLRVYDTSLRSRLQAWMDLLKEEWA